MPTHAPSSPIPPLTRQACVQRGWLPKDGPPGPNHGVDFVLVTGDAYVDHPSFANAVLARLLQARGYRVAVLSQPNWRSAAPFRAFGPPQIAWLVSAGNLDSMLNNYTASKRPRRDDQYAPDAQGGLRPDHATIVYAQRCREAFKAVPVIAGGVEASMRRIAHFDYWSDRVKRSIALDAKVDLLVYGMGERPLVDLLTRHAAGEPLKAIHDIPGTAYVVGRTGRPHFVPKALPAGVDWRDHLPQHVTALPAYEALRGADPTSKAAFARAAHLFHKAHNPALGQILIQAHGDQTLVVNPPQFPLSTPELDAIFALPYTKRPHPDYGTARIPAWEMVRFSVNVMRGCFGGCTFCAITEHQGKAIQSRSKESVLAEVDAMRKLPGYTGVLSDLGGPTANMYRMRCSRPEVEKTCRRPSCVHPRICKLLTTDHQPIRELMAAVRAAAGVKKVLIASGVRMDLANRDPRYIDDLATHHVGGHLKVAPEHADPDTLYLMKKPGLDVYLNFERRFNQASAKAGKEQYLVPYFVSSHPGCDMNGAVALGEFLRARNLRPRQVQDFIPTPSTPATCMWWTGIDPHTGAPVFVERKMRGKRKQKALMQYFLKDNEPLVREALHETGRTDLIGRHGKALVGYGSPQRPRARKPRPPKGPG